MKKSTAPAAVPHQEWLIKQLRTKPQFASEYLAAAMEDVEEPRVLLSALRNLAEARGGITKIARKAGIERESLHRALSGRGNPRFSTLIAITNALGLRLSVEEIASERKPKRRSA